MMPSSRKAIGIALLLGIVHVCLSVSRVAGKDAPEEQKRKKHAEHVEKPKKAEKPEKVEKPSHRAQIMAESYGSNITDPREKDLWLSVKQASRFHGKSSNAWLERILDLANFYAEKNQNDKLLELADSIQEAFAKLSSTDKEYFAKVMLRHASSLATNKNNLNGSEVFYHPALEQVFASPWSDEESAEQARSIAYRMSNEHHYVEAEQLLNAADLLTKNGQNQASRREILDQLAKLHMKTRKFDKAAAAIEELLTLPVVVNGPQYFSFLNSMTKVYADSGRRDKLEAMLPTLRKEFKQLDYRRDSREAASIIQILVKQNFLSPASELTETLLSTINSSKESQNPISEAQQAIRPIADAYISVGQIGPCQDLFRAWVADVEKKYGQGSSEALEATQQRMYFLRSHQLPVDNIAIVAKLKSEIKGLSTAKQKLEAIQLLQSVERGSSSDTVAMLDQLLADVPQGADGAKVLLNASSLYERNGAKDKSDKAISDFLTRVTGLLKPEDEYLIPYLKQLNSPVGSGSQRRLSSDSLRNSGDEIISRLDDRSRGRQLDDVVYHLLLTVGDSEKANQLLAIKLKKAVSTKLDARVEILMKEYVRGLSAASGVRVDSNVEPDIKYVREAYKVVLEGILQSKWTKEKDRTGITKVQFDVEREGIKNAAVEHSTASAAESQRARDCVELLNSISDRLPGFGGMHFTASFNHSNGSVSVL